MSEIEETEALLSNLQASEDSLESLARAAAALRKSKDRSIIVWLVVGLYVFAIVIAILYLCARAIFCIECNEAAFGDMSELIKVAVLPVLTLVIGYYFGSSSKAE